VNGQQGGGGHFYVTVSTSTFAQARGCIPGWTISGSCYKQLMSRTTNKKVAIIEISFLTEFAGLGCGFEPRGLLADRSTIWSRGEKKSRRTLAKFLLENLSTMNRVAGKTGL